MLSVAVKVVIGTTSELPVAGIEKAVTCGAVTSLIVTTVGALSELETLPAASLAQAKRVLEPAVVKVYVVGAEALQPAAVANGAVEVSVMR
jgi:hypothetical protein